MRTRSLQPAGLLAAGLVLALLAGTGCVPGVAWAPDSSGFYFTARDNTRLVYFDMKTARQRTVVENIGGKTFWPAVSPDGKRVAVAWVETPKGRSSGLTRFS